MAAMSASRTAKIVFAVIGVSWTILLGVLTLDRVRDIRTDADELAAKEGSVHYKWVVIFRKWVAVHGGVYVPVDKDTPPNEYLEAFERDITTPSGRPLTLMNPAYAIRQVYEMYEAESGVKGHITSLNPIRPANAPDEWERKALTLVEREGRTDVWEHVTLNNRSYLRLLKPLYVEPPCLKCHAKQGYKLGDVRGGISVYIPMAEFEKRRGEEIMEMLQAHMIIWLLGIGGIGVSNRLLTIHIRRREEAESRLLETNESLHGIMDNTSNTIFALNVKGEVQFVNRAVEAISGFSVDDIIGRRFHHLLALRESRAEALRVFHACLAGASRKGFEADIKRKDGQIRHLLFNVSPVFDERGRVLKIVGAAEDITEQKRAQEAEAMRLRSTETNNLMQAVYIAKSDPPVLFNQILGLLVKFTESEFGFIAEYFEDDGGKPYLMTLAASRMPWSGEAAEFYGKDGETGHKFDNLEGIFGALVKTGEPYVSNNVSSDPRSLDFPPGHPEIRSFMGFPIRKGKDVLGAFCVANRPGGYSDLLVDAMGPLLSTCANIIDAARDERIEKKRREELLAAKEMAETATKEKDKYVSLIAHDLKAPFTSTIGFLRLLSLDDNFTVKGKYAELLEATIRSSDRALTMIDEVLHVSRFHLGGIALKKRFFDAYRAAFAVVVNYKHIAASKGVEMVNEVAEGTRLYADPALLEEVLNNLVINAIKFSRKGGKITVFSPPGEAGVIAVRDTGAGIDEKMIPNLFRHDIKTSTVGTMGELGTGLGLPLCQDIMRAHGGVLTVESEKGVGTVFHARLPYKKPLALVADDDLAVRYMLGIYLRDIGINVIEADNGDAAFETVKSGNPDLILLDVYMPGVDGFEFLRWVKQDQKTREIPVIVITSDNRLETRERVIRMGAEDFITKPVTEEEIIPRARRFVG